MNAKKGLLALAVMAIAMMGFSSSATAAEGGEVRDVNNDPIEEGKIVHYEGWAAFDGTGSFTCHVTATTEAVTATTGYVTQFTVPNTEQCTGTFPLGSCKLKSHESTTTSSEGKETWALTATKGDFDVKPTNGATKLVIHEEFEGLFCPLAGEEITLTFDEITLKPLNTENKRQVTNTAGNLGDTAALGDPISGIEISGTGKLDTEDGEEHDITATGELEVTGEDLCTWKLVAA